MSHLVEMGTHSIYVDLMRKFRDEGHKVYIVTPRERRLGEKTHLYEEGGSFFLAVKTLNLQKTNLIEKGVGQVMVESQFKRAIEKYFGDVRFDLILYSTPPITLMGVVKHLKKKNPQAVSYLMLKDIFPQNAVDIGMMSKSGMKGILYKYFRKQEKDLYKVSDYIGCMSPANVEFVLKHNPEVTPSKVEVAPNSLELSVQRLESVEGGELKVKVREKYGLPMDKPVFIYGGNLGKPQGIPFLIQCLEKNAGRNDCHFLVIGSGTELPRLKTWYNDKMPKSVTIMDGLPTAEYDELVKACDVGMIFLDHRFTIPNFPSRLLSYIENRMPVLCATDPNCDMGAIAEKNGFGFWCESNSVEDFNAILDKMILADRTKMGEAGYQFLLNNYLVEHTYNKIIKHV